MKTRIERSSLPDLAVLRKLLGERADQICQGARLIDADAQGPTGIDLIIADSDGRPVFVDIVLERPLEVPTLIFDHLDWFESNKRLFLKAYAEEGVRNTGSPAFVFVAAGFPSGVMRAVGAMEGIDARLVRADYVLVNGTGEVLLEDVTPDGGTREGTVVVRPTDDADDGSRTPIETKPEETRTEETVESDTVRMLLDLFRSGVDGLDSRISQLTADDSIVCALRGRPLARVTVSSGSFTVLPGDQGENPIVVSDRVSLERALNAVVSLFVREEEPFLAEDEDRPSTAKLRDEERAELAEIWRGGAAPGDAG